MVNAVIYGQKNKCVSATGNKLVFFIILVVLLFYLLSKEGDFYDRSTLMYNYYDVASCLLHLAVTITLYMIKKDD